MILVNQQYRFLAVLAMMNNQKLPVRNVGLAWILKSARYSEPGVEKVQCPLGIAPFELTI